MFVDLSLLILYLFPYLYYELEIIVETTFLFPEGVTAKHIMSSNQVIFCATCKDIFLSHHKRRKSTVEGFIPNTLFRGILHNVKCNRRFYRM